MAMRGKVSGMGRNTKMLPRSGSWHQSCVGGNAPGRSIVIDRRSEGRELPDMLRAQSGQDRHEHVQRYRDEERQAWQSLQAVGEQLAAWAGSPAVREGLRADYERAYRAWHRARYALDLALVPPPESSPAPAPHAPRRGDTAEIADPQARLRRVH